LGFDAAAADAEDEDDVRDELEAEAVEGVAEDEDAARFWIEKSSLLQLGAAAPLAADLTPPPPFDFFFLLPAVVAPPATGSVFCILAATAPFVLFSFVICSRALRFSAFFVSLDDDEDDVESGSADSASLAAAAAANRMLSIEFVGEIESVRSEDEPLATASVFSVESTEAEGEDDDALWLWLWCECFLVDL
jgi:hypothetical protein